MIYNNSTKYYKPGIDIEVFKTDVQEFSEANRLLEILVAHFPGCSFNFDLDDCDRILRAKDMGGIRDISRLIELVGATGHRIEVLPG